MEEKTVEEAATYLGVRPGYIRLLIHKKQLKKGRQLGKRMYLIENASLEKYASKQRAAKGRPRSGEQECNSKK